MIKPENVTGVECRFAVYCPTPKNESRDLHIVKQIIHTADGHKIPNVKLIWDFRRDFYITKKGARNHEQKKEFEYIENLNQYQTTQLKLQQSIARALEMPYFKGDMRKLCRSPYVYGADILSTALIKEKYKKKYPDLNTYFSVACFDVETDVVHGTEEIIMATLSYKERVVTVIKESVVSGYANVKERLTLLSEKYVGDLYKKRNIKWDIIIVKEEHEIILECFKKAHEWKPDFVAIWNITFDMGKMLTALQKVNIDPKDVFSDPAVPRDYRFFEFKQGPKQKVTASGKITPIKPAAQWHTVYCPSSFYFIDAMCAFKHIRTGEADKQSYALDAILEDSKAGITKLKFDEAKNYHGIEWHQFMQQNYPLEYIIYNVVDCISMEILDELTLDLALSLPMMSKHSDFANFKSQPRRLVDDLHFFFLENNRVISTTSDEMSSEADLDTVGLEDWI